MRIDIPEQMKVISRYGINAQAMVHMEEAAELIQAASKMRRAFCGEDMEARKNARSNLVEEMADVLICMKQMQEIYCVSDDEIQNMVYTKCKRQVLRL